jgi:thiosulfate dehydrogenase [quinone] large subunit
VSALVREFEGSGLPSFTIRAIGRTLPYLETGIGLLLVCGLETRSGLIAGCFLMFLLLAGKSLVSDWVTVTFQMIYVLIYCILLFYLKYDSISVDALFSVKT